MFILKLEEFQSTWLIQTASVFDTKKLHNNRIMKFKKEEEKEKVKVEQSFKKYEILVQD